MLKFIQSVSKPNGSIGYKYDFDDDVAIIAQSIIDNADTPFNFIGKLNEKQSDIHPAYIEGTLERGGQIAGRAIINGKSAIINFLSNNQLMVSLPLGAGSQQDADELVGAAFEIDEYDDFENDEYSYSEGYDDFDNDEYEDSDDLDDEPNGFDDDIDINDLYNKIPDPKGNSISPGIDPRTAMAMDQKTASISFIDWLFTLIILLIPVINIVYVLFGLISKKTNPTKKNFLKAEAIFVGVSTFFIAYTIILATSMGIDLVGIITGQESPTAQQTTQQQSEQQDQNKNNTNENNDNNSQSQNASANNQEASNTQQASQQPPVETKEIEPFYTDKGQIESIVKEVTLSGEKLAIINIKGRNWRPGEASPFDLYKIDATQGQNALQMHLAGTSSYDPSKWTVKLAPNAETIFQIAFKMIDDQNVHIRITNTNEVNDLIAEASRHLA